MFHLFKKKNETIITSPVKGKLVPLAEVPDPTFSEEILGKGVAIIPETGEIYAPVDGTITVLIETLHAISITADNGVEILIHIGLETVSLKGKGFTSHIKQDDHVKRGDLLITVDLDVLRDAGKNSIVPVIICNSDAYSEIKPSEAGVINKNDTILTLCAK